VVTTFAGSGSQGSADGTGTAATFNRPTGVAVDDSGNVYVADDYNHLIRKITAAGVVTTLAGTGSEGSADGTGTAASFKYPEGVAVDGSGNVYVADTWNHLIRKITSAGVVTTFAGTGSEGSADGTGTAASFRFPRDVAVDGSGNVYVADALNHKIRKITPSGIVTTFAGDGSANSEDGTGTPASFNLPWGVAVDDSGNVYVAEKNGHKIRKIATTLASGSTTSDTTLPLIFTSSEATTDFAEDDITVTNGALSDFTASTSSTVYTATFTPTAEGLATIDVAENTFTDSAGNNNTAAAQYTWTYNQNLIVAVAPTMTIATTLEITPEVTTLAGSGSSGSADGTGTAASFDEPQGVAVDGSGNVYVADYSNHLIRKITPAGVVTTLAGFVNCEGFIDGPSTEALFDEPYGVAVDGNGNLYVGERDNNVIRKITPAGVVTTFAGSGSEGSADGTGTSASFYSPTGVAVDGIGNAYVADRDNHLIRKITSAGVVTTFAGSGSQGSADGTGTAATFNRPTGVAVDGSGNVYVADRDNHLIRKITSAGVVTTFAGSGSAGSTNGTVTEASFYFPAGVAVDGSGNVYVADRDNHLIRKITSAGVVTTFAGSGSSGSADGTSTEATFNRPTGVAVDGSGNVYVADRDNHLIRKIATTLASGSTTNDATLPLIFTSGKPTTDFAEDDITVTNGALSDFAASSSTVYTAIFTPTANGEATIDVAESTFTDAAGNVNTAATQYTWTYSVLSINGELLPEVFALHQNYPNPFNPVTTLRYDLPENGHVNITIYDMLGRQVKTLINQTQDAGYKSVIWAGTDTNSKPVSAGIYLYQIQAGEYLQTKKMVLLK
jgi:hypothetical protein